MPVYAYRFYDENKKAAKYWRDIGTLDAYYDANMDLCHVNPDFNLYDPEWPLRTYQVQAPPAKFVFADEGRRCGQALDSIISAGCIISGSRITGSVLCPNVRVHSFCDIDQSILMPGVRVGRHARIRRAIVDRDVFVPRGALIGYNEEEDRRRHTVSDSGIVVVTTDDEPFIGDDLARRRCGTSRSSTSEGRVEQGADRRLQAAVARVRSAKVRRATCAERERAACYRDAHVSEAIQRQTSHKVTSREDSGSQGARDSSIRAGIRRSKWT